MNQQIDLAIVLKLAVNTIVTGREPGMACQQGLHRPFCEAHNSIFGRCISAEPHIIDRVKAGLAEVLLDGFAVNLILDSADLNMGITIVRERHTVDTASIKQDIEKTRQEKESAPAAPEQATPQKDAEDILLDEMMGAPIQKEPPSPENPTAAKTEKSPPSAPTSGTQKRTAEGTAKESRPSVREELREIKAARQEKAEVPKQQEAARPNKQPLPPVQMHQNPGKKKPKVKAR